MKLYWGLLAEKLAQCSDEIFIHTARTALTIKKGGMEFNITKRLKGI